MIAPGIGSIVGGMLGSELGRLWGGNDARRNRKRSELGLEYLNGDYSVKELKQIKSGKVSGELQTKMEKYGDTTLDEKYKKENNEYLGLSAEYLGDIHDVIVNGGYGIQRANGGAVFGKAGKDKIPA